MNFDLSPRAQEWRGRVQAFFDAGILPRNHDWHEHVVRRVEPAPWSVAASPYLQEQLP